ncbi:FUSC family protein [Mycolicibacterium neoaurum]|uniref:FUSC family protein n=1 Tax=Mycolicibacterium neoaurum TaxID=1795 RepID=UPI00248C32F8|nr:FUSC family protein [Mycolicibacterium neoaurum]WBP92237.1 FUSC family protein [Mycolicibacterium neoaurum]WBS10608.1 FUSC family protein [Mycolicibacterium neoaurum]
MTTSRRLRLTLYDSGAVIRSLAGVVAITVPAILLGIPAQLSAVASAAMAGMVAGASALQDSPRGRFPIVVLVSAEMALAVLLGALTGGSDLALLIALALWCVVAGLHWALSANAGLVAAAGAALLLTAEPPATASAAVSAAALALAAGLTQAVLIALWPQRRWRDQRSALTRAYLSLATYAGSMLTDPGAEMNAEPLLQLREAFTVNEAMAKRRPPIYRGWYGLPERISESLTGLREHTDDEAVARLLRAAADLLTVIAHARRRSRQDLGHALGQLAGSAQAVGGGEPRDTAVRLVGQLREAVELRYGQFEPEQVAHLRRPGLPHALAAAVHLMREQTDRYSPILRHTIRLAAATVIGVAVWRFAGVPHGAWIALTVLMVLRPETAHTYTRCVWRIVGTAAGVALGAVIVAVSGPSPIASTVLAVLLIALAYASAEVSYLAVNTAIAAALVLLLNTGGTGDAAAIADRLLAVLIGGALAVTVHVALPDNALVRLRQRAGELLKTEIDYAAMVVRAFVHDLDHPKEALESAWARAVSARTAFEATAGATGTDWQQLRRWMRSYRAALNAVTTSCATLEANLPAHPPADLDREFVAAVDEYVKALSGNPATPAAPWRVDTDALLAANAGVRTAAALLTDADGAERVLVAEIATITAVVTEVAASDIQVA